MLRLSLVALGLGLGMTGVAPVGAVPTTVPPTRLRPTVRPKPTVKPATPPPPATPPTFAPIPGGTVPASTLPLQTREPSTHVSAVFPILSVAGFIVVLLMLAVQWVLTKPGRQGWTL
jgi:hypothetical protein